ncbi:heptaprenyl diphosphate synthase component 1 [Paenibacillus sp. F411]|uniref:Heptaprenyl diphosphate synthase n=1 Tax=Paenibacillus algicola TaxID=2565926 RepID=A0A4P8XJK4_9BACL|nr:MULTISPECIES: heptaprenyl diphosphate synthase component 1 [Paenibacillus]MBO2945028.1 heptaprenyl diphosphate synthase component 1 [Paenibacillus sp. F411]QCT02558.1 hypothetical protein E6C60_1843 [Paenibacillus algicola]
MKPYRVPAIAQKYLQYDMIQNHTELPEFPDARVHLLYIFMQNHALHRGPERSETAALAASLVQMGLDTHEGIDTVTEVRNEQEMRSRQLKVLAGDYFSSLFYQLLSRSGDIQSIALMSRAVSEVNVMKMKLYSKMKSMLLTSEEYLSNMVQLNMQLFLSFTPLLDASAAGTWRQLLQEFTRCELLMREMDRSASPEAGKEGYSYWLVLENGLEEDKKLLARKDLQLKDWKQLLLKHRSMDKLMDKLSQSLENIQEAWLALGESGGNQIRMASQPFMERLNTCRRAVREG